MINLLYITYTDSFSAIIDIIVIIDAEEPVAKRARGRGRGQSEELTGGGAMEMIVVEKGDVVVQLAEVVVEQEEVQMEA